MRWGEIDRRGWLRLALFAAWLVAIWLVLRVATFPEVPLGVAVWVALVLAFGAVALMLWQWNRDGGYASHQALERWIRGADTPAHVPRGRRRVFLERANERAGRGWFNMVLAVFWVGFAVFQNSSTRDFREFVPFLVVAGLWTVVTVVEFVSVASWRVRARELLAEDRDLPFSTDGG